jgi:23S rRNA (guanosine2251-2'-O)-methyltransferase
MLVKGRKDVNAGSRRRVPHGARWLYGIHAVERRLEVNPASVHEVRLLPSPSDRRATIARLAEAAGIETGPADESTLRSLACTLSHQGVVALVDPREYEDLVSVLERKSGPLLLLDQIQDPHNLGALLRTAAAVRMAAVVLPERGTVGITASVEKVAAGAVNDVAICRVVNLSRALKEIAMAGYWSIALSPRAEQSLFRMEIPERSALVLGGEGGLRPLVERSCDFQASIPTPGPVESLNVSVAGAIAMYEIYRRSLAG